MKTATALKAMPAPATKHGPATRRVTLSRRHDGQIVTPVVHAWHAGTGYVIQLSAYDSSDRTYAPPLEYAGSYRACTRWLEARGVDADIDAP